MKSRKPWFFILIILLIAIILAPIIWIIIQFIIIEPIIYYWWGIKRGLALIPQYIYWLFFVVSLALFASGFLLRNIVSGDQESSLSNNFTSPVESLSESITRTKTSNYFRWLIANQLALLTIGILKPSQKKTLKSRISLTELNDLFKDFPDEIKHYLLFGMDSSLIKTRSRNFLPFKKRIIPELDVDLDEIITNIELLLE